MKGDKTFWNPPIGNRLTYNELHAMLIGLGVGFFSGTAMGTQHEIAALGILLTLAGYSIMGDRVFEIVRKIQAKRKDGPTIAGEGEEDETIGLKTIRLEPWYFLGLLAVGFYLGSNGIGIPI